MFRIRNAVRVTVLSILLLYGATVFGAQQNLLAIMNLRPTNLEAMGYDGDLLYALISSLEKEKTINLMPRREMEEILFNAGLVQGDSPESALKIGKVLAADFVLFGHVTKELGRVKANISLMDVQHGREIKTWLQTFSGRDNILARIPSFADELVNVIKYRNQVARSSIRAEAEKAPPPVSIENLKAKSAGKNVALAWKFDRSQPITGFHIYRSEKEAGPYQFIGQTDQDLFEDSTIKRGKTYYYRLGILNRSGQEVKDSQYVEIKNAGEKTPHPPLLMSGTSFIKRAQIKFVPSLLNSQEKFKIKQYKIYRKNSETASWRHIDSLNAKVSSQSEFGFTIEDCKELQDGCSYLYAVSSVDDKDRESPLSDSLRIQLPDRPDLTVRKDGMLRKVSFSWEPIDTAEGYYLYRKEDPADWTRVARIRGGATTQFVDDKDLEDGRVYRYYLTAYDRYGETGASDVQKAATKTVPGYPSDLIPQSEMVKSVRLSWTPVDDPDIGGYVIYRGPDRKERQRVAKVKGYQTATYHDKGKTYAPLEDGAYYYYRISSYNLFGAEGEISPAEIARTKPRPESVQGLQVAASGERILIQWRLNSEPDIDGYIVYRSKNGGSFTKLTTTGSEKYQHVDDDLKPDVIYRYLVVVEDKDGLKSDPVESDAIQSPMTKPAS